MCAVRLTDKILPLNDAFIGIVDCNQVLDTAAVSGHILVSDGQRFISTAPSSGMVYPGAGIALSTGSAWGTSIADASANWNSAYSHKTTEDAINGLVKCNGTGSYSAITDSSGNWNTAYGWGNHASAGYLTSQISHADVLVDGDFASQGIMLRGVSAGVYSILTDASNNWNTAYGWGNHASAGYVTGTPWTGMGYLTGVTADAPITGSGTAASHLVMAAATTSVPGYLTAADWTTFNAKQPAGSYYTVAGTDVPVTDGGTGVSSLTAYAVLCGGTTTTGAVQPIASVGTTGTVLTSNGASTLPTFQAVPAYPVTVTSVTTTPYTILSTDMYLLVNTSSAKTLTLPAASTKRVLYIKDISGTAGTNNITLTRAGSDSIEGVAENKTLQTNWGAWTILSDGGTNWYII